VSTPKPPAVDVLGHAAAPESALAALAASPRVVALRSGRQIEIGGEGGEGGEEWITVRDASGEALVTMRLGDEGPIFSFSQGSLAIEASEELSLSCETLRVESRGSARIDVGGSLHEQVGGDVVRRSGGASSSVARAVAITASPGGIGLEATGDVSLDGERIRLNSEDPPMPLTWDEHRARQARAIGEGAARAGLDPSAEGEGAKPR
jgi:hypothetical protein